MTNKIRACITGVGGYVPDYILTNKELESMVDTNDEWIVSRTGIKERRILKDQDKASVYMGTQAALQVLQKTNTKPSEIDAIICCTVTPDMIFPASANLMGHQLGAVKAFGYDLIAACSGFLYGLTTATAFVESGRFKKVLLVGVDKMSTIVDYTNRNTCILFGDGAGAVLIEPSSNGHGIIDTLLCSDGSGGDFLRMNAGGSLRPASHETIAAREHYIHQEGAIVYKFAVSRMSEVVEEVMRRNQLNASDVTYLLPHQANKRIIDATAQKAGLADEQVLVNIHRYGNTTNATIPLCMWDFEQKFRKGDTLLLAAFGGGFTWGALYMTWAYDPV